MVVVILFPLLFSLILGLVRPHFISFRLYERKLIIYPVAASCNIIPLCILTASYHALTTVRSFVSIRSLVTWLCLCTFLGTDYLFNEAC